MVMYEIWSLGHKPFEEWEIEDVSTNTHYANICIYMQYTHVFHRSKRYVSSYNICTIHCIVPSTYEEIILCNYVQVDTAPCYCCA